MTRGLLYIVCDSTCSKEIGLLSRLLRVLGVDFLRSSSDADMVGLWEQACLEPSSGELWVSLGDPRLLKISVTLDLRLGRVRSGSGGCVERGGQCCS